MSKKRSDKQAEQVEEPFSFDGFEPANTTPVPDVFFDVLMPHLNEAQLKVMLYIIRRTLGFKKGSDAISLTQFRYGITTKSGKKLDSGCGLKNFTTISKALKSLEEMNCIESVKGKTTEGDQATTVYRVRFRGTTSTVVPTTQPVVGVLQQTEDRTPSSGVRVLRQTESQETVIQQTVKQNTDIQERDSAPAKEQINKPATMPPTPNNFFNEKIEQFRNVFIVLGKEMFAYDKFTTSRVQPTSEVATRILEIVGDGEVSEQAMRRAFLKLWNHKDKDGTYWWRDKSKLTLKAYVNNYDDQEDRKPVGQLMASTPGSQYIVDELEEVAQGYINQQSDVQGSTRRTDKLNAQEAYENFVEYGLIYGKLPEYWTQEHIEQVDVKKQISIRLLLDEWKKGQQLITTGPLAGQPRYDADPWL